MTVVFGSRLSVEGFATITANGKGLGEGGDKKDGNSN